MATAEEGGQKEPAGQVVQQHTPAAEKVPAAQEIMRMRLLL